MVRRKKNPAPGSSRPHVDNPDHLDHLSKRQRVDDHQVSGAPWPASVATPTREVEDAGAQAALKPVKKKVRPSKNRRSKDRVGRQTNRANARASGKYNLHLELLRDDPLDPQGARYFEEELGYHNRVYRQGEGAYSLEDSEMYRDTRPQEFAGVGELPSGALVVKDDGPVVKVEDVDNGAGALSSVALAVEDGGPAAKVEDQVLMFRVKNEGTVVKVESVDNETS